MAFDLCVLGGYRGERAAAKQVQIMQGDLLHFCVSPEASHFAGLGSMHTSGFFFKPLEAVLNIFFFSTP